MATFATTVELDAELQQRVEQIAEARHESAGAVIRDAVAQYIVSVGKRHAFRDTSSAEFKAEYRKQRVAIAEHYRRSNFADSFEPTEDDLKGWV